MTTGMARTYDADDPFERRLHILEVALVQPNFPDTTSYGSSQWAEWIDRIKAGEEKIVEDLTRDEVSSGPEFDARVWVECDLSDAAFVRNSMHGAMLVTLWAAMEYLLREVLRAGIEGMGLSDRGDEESTRPALWETIYVGDLILSYKQQLNLDLTELPGQETVNAVRVLNNAFKHDYGHYTPSERSGPPIPRHVLEKWNIINKYKEIVYSRLPFADLVQACHEFSKAILEHVRSHVCEIRSD